MNSEQRLAINDFLKAVKGLKDSKIIRSDRLLGDLAEFLCSDLLGIDLAANLRQTGHDGMRDHLRAQIKYAGGTKTNVDLGNPEKYDEVYVVLGKECILRQYKHDADYLIYRLTSEEVKRIGKTAQGKYSCGVSYFRSEPFEVIFLNDDNEAKQMVRTTCLFSETG